MSKELTVAPGVKRGLVEGLAALPDPGKGKRLIVFVRASDVRLRIVDTASTIQGQELESREGQ